MRSWSELILKDSKYRPRQNSDSHRLSHCQVNGAAVSGNDVKKGEGRRFQALHGNPAEPRFASDVIWVQPRLGGARTVVAKYRQRQQRPSSSSPPSTLAVPIFCPIVPEPPESKMKRPGQCQPLKLKCDARDTTGSTIFSSVAAHTHNQSSGSLASRVSFSRSLTLAAASQHYTPGGQFGHAGQNEKGRR
jgi:hypothetical protein